MYSSVCLWPLFEKVYHAQRSDRIDSNTYSLMCLFLFAPLTVWPDSSSRNIKADLSLLAKQTTPLVQAHSPVCPWRIVDAASNTCMRLEPSGCGATQEGQSSRHLAPRHQNPRSDFFHWLLQLCTHSMMQNILRFKYSCVNACQSQSTASM